MQEWSIRESFRDVRFAEDLPQPDAFFEMQDALEVPQYVERWGNERDQSGYKIRIKDVSPTLDVFRRRGTTSLQMKVFGFLKDLLSTVLNVVALEDPNLFHCNFGGRTSTGVNSIWLTFDRESLCDAMLCKVALNYAWSHCPRINLNEQRPGVPYWGNEYGCMWVNAHYGDAEHQRAGVGRALADAS